MMSQTKVTKSKPKQPKQLKVMHHIEKDGNGNATIKSIVSNPPKLKEATDKVQAAEETGHKLPPLPKVKTDKPKDELTDVEREVLGALNALGGKDVHSSDIVLLLAGFKDPKDIEKAINKWGPRGKVRAAMERLSELHLVTSKKQGVRYNFSITERGKTALTTKDSKDKGANPVPASTGLNEGVLNAVGRVVPAAIQRPSNTDVQCQACKTWNVFSADFCKECGKSMKPVETVMAA